MLQLNKFPKSLLTISLVSALNACGGGGDDSESASSLQCIAPQVLNAQGTACVAAQSAEQQEQEESPEQHPEQQPEESPEQHNTEPQIDSGASFSLEELTANGEVVYTAMATDDEGDGLSWTLDDPKNIFEIDTVSGDLTVKDSQSLVAAELSNYQISLTVTDNASDAKSTTIKVTVSVIAKQSELCELPEVTHVVDEDFHPLSQQEKDALRLAVDPEGTWEQAKVDAWNAADSRDVYDYKYEDIDMYAVLGLTKEEFARQATAKEEARVFKRDTQNQGVIFSDNFDEWFEDWFATIPEANYLGESQRLAKATRGFELSLSAANNTEEVCYSPPTSCPNFQIVDDTGTYDCITPEANPLAEEQPNSGVTETIVEVGHARLYFKAEGHIDGAAPAQNADIYQDIIIHAWNSPTCTAYTEEEVTGWSQGPSGDGIDPDYGMYWDLELTEEHDSCANIIVYNKVLGDAGKKISSSDLRLPLGHSDSLFVNTDKTSYLQEGINALNYDGDLYANQHPLIGAGTGTKTCEWGTELNESGDVCVGQIIENCPDGTVAVGVYQDASDPAFSARQIDMPSKCVIVFEPAEAILYVRGSYHSTGWEADENNQMVFDGSNKFFLNSPYQAHPEGSSANEDGSVSHSFKVADVDWTEKTNFGAISGGSTPMLNAGNVNLTVGEGVAQNLTMDFEENKVYQFVLDATNPVAAKLRVSDVPVDTIPTISINSSEAVVFNYSGDSKYTLQEQTLEAGTHTITLGDLTSNMALGAAQGSETLTNNEAVNLASSTTALSFTVDAGTYNFVLDLSDVEQPTFKYTNARPLPADSVYLRGGFTSGWDARDEMAYDEGNRSYSVLLGMEAGGNVEFKIADANWSDVNLGSAEVTFADSGLALSGTGNIRVAIDKQTTYKFSISFASGPVGEVKVEEAPIYIRGGIYGTGDWAADEAMRLNFTGVDDGNSTEGSQIFSSEITTTGTGSFKIADADWGGAFGFNYGVTQEQADAGEDQVVLGQAMKLTFGSDGRNINFNHPAGTYIFSFDNVTKELTVTAK